MDDPQVHTPEAAVDQTKGWRRFADAGLSLQCKATVLVVALTLAVTAVVSGYFLRASVKLAREYHDEELVQLAGMVARAAASPISDGDWEALQEFAEDAADGKPLRYVIFSDTQSRVLAAAQHGQSDILEQHRRNLANRSLPGVPTFHATSATPPGCLDVTYPINIHVKDDALSEENTVRLIGYVHTGMAGNVWHQWMASKLDTVIGVGSLAIAFAIPLGFLLVRRIVSPLEGLAVTMDRFSQGKLDVRSPVHRQDEIGRLALAFNRMADQHEQTHAGIVRLNADLENRVAQRTRQLRDLAARDPLTGLYNRRHFNEVLERGFSEALRYDNDLSCIMVDLDDFKAVNDAFGHQVGDELLMLMASTITGQLRSADVPARFGGDEFIMLLPQTGVDRARVLAERIAGKFSENATAALPRVRTSASMGVASLEALRVADAESLIRTVDRALYDAKASGKNCIVTAVVPAEHPSA